MQGCCCCCCCCCLLRAIPYSHSNETTMVTMTTTTTSGHPGELVASVGDCFFGHDTPSSSNKTKPLPSSFCVFCGLETFRLESRNEDRREEKTTSAGKAEHDDELVERALSDMNCFFFLFFSFSFFPFSFFYSPGHYYK